MNSVLRFFFLSLRMFLMARRAQSSTIRHRYFSSREALSPLLSLSFSLSLCQTRDGENFWLFLTSKSPFLSSRPRRRPDSSGRVEMFYFRECGESRKTGTISTALFADGNKENSRERVSLLDSESLLSDVSLVAEEN